MMIMMMKLRMSWVPFLADNPPSTDLFSLFSFNNQAADISLLFSFVCVLSPRVGGTGRVLDLSFLFLL